MAGEIAPTSAASAPPAPAVDVAASAPAAPIAELAAPAAVDGVAPVAEPAPTLVEAAAEPVAEPVTESPAEPLVAEAENPADDAPPVVAQPLAYEAFKLPEGFAPADDQIKAFTDLIGTHQLPQETAQGLIDLHTSELKKFAERQSQQQQDVFAETNRQWIAQVDKTFGNRRDTVVNDAKAFITRIVPDAKKRAEIYQVMAFTGAGNHPALIGLLSAAEKKMNERGSPPPSVPGGDRRGQSAADKRYGATR